MEITARPISTVVAALYLGCAAWPASAAPELEEVIVSAQKKPETLDQVPLSISVLTGRYLERRGIETLEQLTANQPAIDISKNSAAGKVFMRGIGSQGNAGMDQSVSMFIDEVYHGRSRHTKAGLVDIERVEILKGPQSTFFGVNSSAGAIAITTRGPSLDGAGGYVRTRIGTDGGFGGTVAYNQPFGDSFALRAVADIGDGGDVWTMVDPVSGRKTGDGGGGQSRTFRLASVWRGTETFQLNLKLEHQDIERENPYAWQPGGCDNLYGLGLSSQAELDRFWAGTGSNQANPLAVPFSCEAGFSDGEFDSRSPALPFNRSDLGAVEALVRAQWELAGVTILSTTAWFDHEFMFEGNDLSHGGPAHRVFWVEDNSDQVSQELRAHSAPGDALAWTVGAYWQSGRADYQTGDADARNAMNPQFIHTLADQDESTWSVFASLEYLLNAKWKLGTGLRWSHTDKDFAGVDERIRSNTVAPALRDAFRAQVLDDVSGDPAAYREYGRQVRAEFDDERRSFGEWLPSLSVSYQFSDDLMSYYSWRRGYKSGGFNFRLNGLDRSTLSYDSETVSAHELGLKGLFLDQRLRLGVSLFVSDYDGLQQNSNRGDDGVISAAVIRNAAAASSDGIEVESSWQVTERWRADLSMVWLDAKFDDYRGADCTRFQSVVSRTDVAARFGAERTGNRCAQDLSGKRLTSAPELSARLALGYSKALGPRLQLDSVIEWFYSDGFFTSPHADPLRMQDSFDKANAELSVSDLYQRWKLSLVATNVFDRLTARQLGQDGDAAVSGLLDDPRQVFLQFQYNF